MKYTLILLVLLLIPLFQAETTLYENPSESLIMSNFTKSSEVIGGMEISEAIKAVSGGWCRYNWDCTNWGECLPEGKQIRNCTNDGNCFGNYGIPKLEKDCDYVSLAEENRTQLSPEVANIKETNNKMFFFIIIALIIVIIALIILYLKKYGLYYMH